MGEYIAFHLKNVMIISELSSNYNANFNLTLYFGYLWYKPWEKHVRQ